MLKLHLAWLRVDRPDDLNPVEDDLRNLSSDELVALQKAITSQLDQRRIAAGNTITEDERALALSGNAIAAIKQIRERTGLGLHEAKNLLDYAVPIEQRRRGP